MKKSGIFYVHGLKQSGGYYIIKDVWLAAIKDKRRRVVRHEAAMLQDALEWFFFQGGRITDEERERLYAIDANRPSKPVGSVRFMIDELGRRYWHACTTARGRKESSDFDKLEDAVAWLADAGGISPEDAQRFVDSLDKIRQSGCMKPKLAIRHENDKVADEMLAQNLAKAREATEKYSEATASMKTSARRAFDAWALCCVDLKDDSAKLFDDVENAIGHAVSHSGMTRFHVLEMLGGFDGALNRARALSSL